MSEKRSVWGRVGACPERRRGDPARPREARLFPAGRNRRAPAPHIPAALSATASSRAKFRTKTPSFSAASPDTPACSPPPKTSPASPTPCFNVAQALLNVARALPSTRCARSGQALPAKCPQRRHRQAQARRPLPASSTPSSAPKPSRSSPAAKPRPLALLAPSAGTRLPPLRSRENISAHPPSAILVTLELRYGSTPCAGFRSLF